MTEACLLLSDFKKVGFELKITEVNRSFALKPKYFFLPILALCLQF